MTPREGVAIHINAFNFPIWGMLEKIASKVSIKKIQTKKTINVIMYLLRKELNYIRGNLNHMNKKINEHKLTAS